MASNRVVTWFVLTGATALAAPLPKTPDAQPYYLPTVVGTKSVYQEKTSLGHTFEYTGVVTESVKTSKGLQVTIKYKREFGDPDVVVSEASNTGVTRLQMGRKELDPPKEVLRSSARKGDGWKWEGTSGTHNFTYGGEEDVEVPAGKFKAIRIDEENKLGKLTVHIKNWYAPNVGLVKQIQTALGETTCVVELKSITQPKK